MGYTKDEQMAASENKRKKKISLDITSELRELTGESFDTLEDCLKEELLKDVQDEQFKIQSKTVLYRELRADANNPLKKDRLKLLGELRIRLIETPIKYDREDKCLRLLCSYEVRTKYLHCKKLDNPNYPITNDFMLKHIETMQNEQLKIPIASVLLTQKLLNEVEDTVSHWDIIEKVKTEKSSTESESDRRTLRLEQNSGSVEPINFQITDKKHKTQILQMVNNVTRHHQSIAKSRLKQHRKLLLADYETYKNTPKSSVQFHCNDGTATGTVAGGAAGAMSLLGGVSVLKH